MMQVFNPRLGRSVGDVRHANSFASRLVGMLLDQPAHECKGLWLSHCSAVHTIGMRAPLDLIFIDRKDCVVKICHAVMPFRPWISAPQAHSVIEFFPGTWDPSAVELGDRLVLAKPSA